MNMIIATHNAHKIEEFGRILAPLGITVQTAELTEAEETGTTFRENAYIKAKSACDETGLPCVADDSGLSIDYLNGEPGVYSARYADGQGHDSQANMNKLLKEMEEKNDRKAQFRTIISLIEKGEERQFEGIVKGQITREKRGESGFGYDPIFQPDGYETTFAELGSDIKNRISHRARAVAALCDYLRKNNY